MQSSLVGGSGERLRGALQVVDAISQGRSLWIATCNSITTLPPELRRRFTLGTFFFDLPSVAERQAIWEIYLKKWNLDGELPDDEGWTGAEIHGLDLTRELTADEIATVRQALLQWKVVFFRDQHLDHDQHLRFANYFGAPTPAHPLFDSIPDPNYPTTHGIDVVRIKRAIGIS